MNFLIFPLIFLSGAFYPLQEAPEWLRIISYFNPLTYGVEALRHVIIGVSFTPLSLSFVIALSFSLVSILVGGFAFSRQK
jgi:ABC-2 type transport system permease protein